MLKVKKQSGSSKITPECFQAPEREHVHAPLGHVKFSIFAYFDSVRVNSLAKFDLKVSFNFAFFSKMNFHHAKIGFFKTLPRGVFIPNLT